jgi:multiple sugar transport system substrate-binding protein
MSELAADAVKLTKKDASGRITQMGLLDGYSAYGSGLLGFIFPYFNVQWYNPARNQITTNSAAAIQALTWEKSLIDQIGVQPYENFTHSTPRNPIGDFFIDGHVGMVLDGDWMCKTMPAYGPKVHWVAAPPPYADGHPEWKNSTWIDGGINIIPTGAAHPKEAYQFVNFMNTTAANVLANTTIGGRSPLKSGDALQAKQGNGCIQLFSQLAQSKRAFPWPVLPMANDLQTQVGTAEDAVVRGQDTAQHALAQIQQKLQAELMAAH